MPQSRHGCITAYHGHDTVTSRLHHGHITVASRRVTVTAQSHHGRVTVTVETQPYHDHDAAVSQSRHGHDTIVRPILPTVQPPLFQLLRTLPATRAHRPPVKRQASNGGRRMPMTMQARSPLPPRARFSSTMRRNALENQHTGAFLLNHAEKRTGRRTHERVSPQPCGETHWKMVTRVRFSAETGRNAPGRYTHPRPIRRPADSWGRRGS